MSSETLVVSCRPQCRRQVRECTAQGTADKPHAVHRELTELTHFSCNCGYSSGWVPLRDLPLASDFIAQHMPGEAVAERMRTMELIHE